MKTVVIFMCLLLVGCCFDLSNQYQSTMIDGYWTAWVIEAENGMVFHTKIGVRGIKIPVKLICRDSHWYVWDNGIWDVLEN